MDDDNTFARMGFIAFCVFTAITSSCTMVLNASNNSAIKEMVSRGADPIKATCAVSGRADQTLCAIAASKP